jgi:hypothetical protein
MVDLLLEELLGFLILPILVYLNPLVTQTLAVHIDYAAQLVLVPVMAASQAQRERTVSLLEISLSSKNLTHRSQTIIDSEVSCVSNLQRL